MRGHDRRALPILFLVAALLPAACGGDTAREDTAPDASEADEEYAEAMAREHEGDEPSPTPATEGPPSLEIVEERVELPAEAGRASGFLARPDGVQSPPGVLVIHEWWGLNDNVRDMARRLAGEGYAALAVDLYRGRVASEPGDARAIMQAAMENPERLRGDLAAAFGYLRETVGSERIGVVGWCFGGGWALQAGLTIPDLNAVVVYYGRVETSAEALAPLEAPVLGHFGGEDQGIPLESVRQFEAALASLGKTATIHVYEGAGHAFANPSGSRYEPESAEAAWTRTLAFFEQHLMPAVPAPGPVPSEP